MNWEPYATPLDRSPSSSNLLLLFLSLLRKFVDLLSHELNSRFFGCLFAVSLVHILSLRIECEFQLINLLGQLFQLTTERDALNLVKPPVLPTFFAIIFSSSPFPFEIRMNRKLELCIGGHSSLFQRKWIGDFRHRRHS